MVGDTTNFAGVGYPRIVPLNPIYELSVNCHNRVVRHQKTISYRLELCELQNDHASPAIAESHEDLVASVWQTLVEKEGFMKEQELNR